MKPLLETDAETAPRFELAVPQSKPHHDGKSTSRNPRSEKPSARGAPPKPERAPDVAFEQLAALCFLTFDAAQRKLLSQVQRAQLNQTLKIMRDAGCDLSRVADFEAWWRADWHSRTSGTNQYQPPRPEQVRSFWAQALPSPKQTETAAERTARLYSCSSNHRPPRICEIQSNT
jgi:hypothetical protein